MMGGWPTEADPIREGQATSGGESIDSWRQDREGHKDRNLAPVSAMHGASVSYDVEQGITDDFSNSRSRAGQSQIKPTRSQSPLRPGNAPSYPSSSSSMGDAAAAEEPDEYAWGPSHPCFPHPNPHVPLSSPLYNSTRIIRIKRDWMLEGDQAPTFSNLYPEILDPYLPEDQFRIVIQHLNTELTHAFDPRGVRNLLDAVLGLMTFWFWDDIGATAVKQRLRRVETWLEQWNHDVGDKEGVRIIPLRRTAYMTVRDYDFPISLLPAY